MQKWDDQQGIDGEMYESGDHDIWNVPGDHWKHQWIHKYHNCTLWRETSVCPLIYVKNYISVDWCVSQTHNLMLM